MPAEGGVPPVLGTVSVGGVLGVVVTSGMVAVWSLPGTVSGGAGGIV
jgi:hypothetical protein